MSSSRVFDWSQLVALVCWLVLAATRVAVLHRRVVPVLAVDRQRAPAQMAVDSLALLCLGAWTYEVVATVWPALRPFSWPAPLQLVLLERLPLRLLGMLLVTTGLGVYGIAVRDLGVSWRIGIDRSAPGPLVTGGIYGLSRHPIYLAFHLIFVGTFLVQGRLLFLVLSAAMALVLHAIMRREERFLAERYGPAYEQYCSRVGRYFSWRKRGG